MKTKHHKWAGILLFVALSLNAQNKKNNGTTSAASSGDKCFSQNTNVLNFGVGFFGNSYYSYRNNRNYYYHSTPAVSVSFEHAIPKPAGPGLLGIGAYIGYQSTYFRYDKNYYYNNNYYYRKDSYRNTMIGFRAAYHLDALNFEKGEVYFGLIAGIRLSTYRYYTNDPDPNVYVSTYRQVNPASSFFVGGRYYFTSNIGVFGELGFGYNYYSALTAGISVKF